ncbi:hypothetical protein [Paludibacter sp. 221]|uniref:hypothetical protein n=1 Tax=Paludibacter sp. 221 TaxID=2302939 RepID=UPI0013D8609C|nr:hypothetical protein [Paludibacter sp. 221]
MKYEEIEQKLIIALKSWTFEEETELTFSKTYNSGSRYKLTFSIPPDDGDMYMILDTPAGQEKYALCYIKLHSEGKKYLEQVLSYLFERADEPVNREIVSFFLE